MPSTSHLLVLSPFTPKYTIHNPFLKTSTTFTVKNFSPLSDQKVVPAGVPVYVKSVTINGKPAKSRCWVDFYDVVRVGGNVDIEVTADRAQAEGCGGVPPDSVSKGGFAQAR